MARGNQQGAGPFWAFVPAGADPAVTRGYLRYLERWAAAGDGDPEPVARIIEEAQAAPPGAIPPRPDLSAPAADVMRWAEATAAYHARREHGLRSARRRAESRRLQHALLAYAAAIRAELA